MVAVTAAAAVWACHRQLSRTTLQYASQPQPLQRQHTLRVPLLISSPLLVRRSLVIDGRATGWLVPAHTPPNCVGTLALFAGDWRVRALQGVVCSTTRQVRHSVLLPTLRSVVL